MNDRLTYPDIIHTYYELNIPHELGKDAHSIFLALVYKASLFDFEITELSIPNSEMCRLTALTERVIYDARPTLIKFRLNGHIQVMPKLSSSYPLVDYKRGFKGQSGVYTTHFDTLMSCNISHPATQTKLSSSNEQVIPVLLEDNLTITTLYDSIYKEGNLSSSDKDENSWLMDQLMNISPGWGGPKNEEERKMLGEILEYPRNQIEIVCKSTARKGYKGSLINWVLRGLDDFEKFHGNGSGNTYKQPTYRDPHKEMITSLMNVYHDHLDGKIPKWHMLDPDQIHIRLKHDIEKVAEYADELDFTPADFEALIVEWEAKA